MNTTTRNAFTRVGAGAGTLALCAALTLGAVSSASATGIAPTAGADAYAVAANTPLSIPAATGLLANDVDPEGDVISVVNLSKSGGSPAGENLVVNADGSFVYTPPTDFVGTRVWSYRPADDTDQGPVVNITFTITGNVVPPVVNSAPVANADAYAVTRDQLLTVATPGVLANDTDVDGDALSVAVGALEPAGGALPGESFGLWADGHFTYMPPTGFTGTRTWTYGVSDGAAGSGLTEIVFTITAPGNVAPVGGADNYSVAQDGWINVPAPGVLANDTDADADALTLVAQGIDTMTLTGEGLTTWADGKLFYHAPAGFSGTRTWWYEVSDGTHTVRTALVFTIAPAPAGNIAPVAEDDVYPIFAGPYDTSAPGVLGNDTDADGDPLNVAKVEPQGSGPMPGESLVIDLNGAIHYVPPTGYIGSRTWRYTVSDGYAESPYATVTFEISPFPVVNTAPVAKNDAYLVVEDMPFTRPGAGYLENDTDADGDSLEWSNLYSPNGGLLPGEDFTMTSLAGAFVYTPPTGFTGVREFTYYGTDGTDLSNLGTITFTVQPPLGGGNNPLIPTLPGDPGVPTPTDDSTVPTLASTGVDGAGLAGTAALSGLLLGGGLIARRFTRREA